MAPSMLALAADVVPITQTGATSWSHVPSHSADR